ncbi:unnamed protein product [Mytilus edulis]|uniref:Uncharacterized protein n=1 Tax=Mytilus edulis TaxID=6550 RepID=A0A8S3U9Y3_MYTED|nr:unnamed protein product [Mytilus edulis]
MTSLVGDKLTESIYTKMHSVEANGREIKDFIKNDLHEILSTLPSVDLLNNMNTVIQDSSIVPPSSRDENDPLLTNLNRTQNSASTETIVATDSTQSLKNCASCSENIIDFDFIWVLLVKKIPFSMSKHNNSIKPHKQTGQKKQKILKQDDLKSKLAVAEAHIAALENTILDNNNVIRNMKLSQLGQTDYHQNGPDHHSYRQTPSSNNANCSNCHCSQLDNRIRDLEREMSNLRLQHLKNQFLTLRQHSQNLVNLQGTPHMNQQGPVHTIHSQHVVQPSPNFSAKPLDTTTSPSFIPAVSSSSTTLHV